MRTYTPSTDVQPDTNQNSKFFIFCNIKKSLSRSYPAKLALMHVGVLFIFRARQNRLVTLRTLRTYLIRKINA